MHRWCDLPPLRIIWTDWLDSDVLADLPLLRGINARVALESGVRELLALLNSPAAMEIDYCCSRRLFSESIPRMLQAVALLPQLRSLSLQPADSSRAWPFYPSCLEA